MMMPELKTLKKISAYIAENNLKATLEAEVKYMVVEAKRNEVNLEGPSKDFKPKPPDKVQDEVQCQRLNTIYDDKPLGFEKDPLANDIKMLTQDPLEEINFGEGEPKRSTYISVNISP